MTLFVGTYGVQFLFGVGFNMSAFTGLELTFTKPDNTTLVVTNPAVGLGVVDIDTDVGTFLANQYVTYTFTIGQLNLAGNWHVRLKYNDATRQLFSKQGRFVVCALD
jgi:hypothetical protein